MGSDQQLTETRRRKSKSSSRKKRESAARSRDLESPDYRACLGDVAVRHLLHRVSGDTPDPAAVSRGVHADSFLPVLSHREKNTRTGQPCRHRPLSVGARHDRVHAWGFRESSTGRSLPNSWDMIMGVIFIVLFWRPPAQLRVDHADHLHPVFCFTPMWGRASVPLEHRGYDLEGSPAHMYMTLEGFSGPH